MKLCSLLCSLVKSQASYMQHGPDLLYISDFRIRHNTGIFFQFVLYVG